jgi:uncharacterized protein
MRALWIFVTALISQGLLSITPVLYDAPLRNDLWNAIKNNEFTAVAQIVEQYPGIVNQPMGENAADRTPLMQAAYTDQGDQDERIALARYLIARGADINAQNTHGETALMLAIRKNFIEMVDFLLEQPGINLNKINHEGDNALLLALQESILNNAAEAMLTLVHEKLLKNPTLNIRHKDNEGNNALIIAVAAYPFGDTNPDGAFYSLHKIWNKILVYLGEKIPINEANTMGTTALLVAAAKPTAKIGQGHNQDGSLVKWILRKGAHINHQNKSGYTALMLALQENNISVAKVLLEHGADTTLRTQEGKTAADFAKDGLEGLS